MNDRFDRAFDDLIASHDVSDEAINRLYDGQPVPITPLDIRYGVICGNVAPDDMRKFLARAVERRKESQEKAERYRRLEEEKAKAQARMEAERKEEIKKQPSVFDKIKRGLEEAIAHEKNLKSTEAQLTPVDEIIDKVKFEFTKLVWYANKKIKELELTAEDADITEKILGVEHISASLNVALSCFQALKVDFANADSQGQIYTIAAIQQGRIKTFDAAKTIVQSYRDNAVIAGSQYVKCLHYNIGKAKALVTGRNAVLHEIYDRYVLLSSVVKTCTVLRVMSVMCEVFGGTTMYNRDTKNLTVPIGKTVDFMATECLSSPINIIWATNTIVDSGSDIISRRVVRDYYPAYTMDSSDILYIGYGMHCLSKKNDNINPAIAYSITGSIFVQRCKTIYENEEKITRFSEHDPAAKKYYHDAYYHVRNVLYANFDVDDDNWTNLADNIAKLSTRLLAKYRGAT